MDADRDDDTVEKAQGGVEHCEMAERRRIERPRVKCDPHRVSRSPDAVLSGHRAATPRRLALRWCGTDLGY
nr:diaminopimelate decarboxylase [Aureimonas sp. AU4]